ncbi:MAG: hypothetical protein ACQESF_03085 [Nanobdellota archaeon]
MRGKRAQAAMEFLMTYGWAILVVLAAVGILAYLGIFDMQKDVAAQCKLRPTGQDMDCTGTPDLDSDAGEIHFKVMNGMPQTATNIALDEQPADCSTLSPISSIGRGETVILNLTDCSLTSGETYQEEFIITYEDEDGLTHNSQGLITGTAR